MSDPLKLSDETVERIALRVVELIDGGSVNPVDEPELVSVEALAKRLHVSTDYVYSHAGELGAIRLGNGPKARLRFDVAKAVEALTPQPFVAPEESSRPTTPRARYGREAELLPIGRPK